MQDWYYLNSHLVLVVEVGVSHAWKHSGRNGFFPIHTQLSCLIPVIILNQYTLTATFKMLHFVVMATDILKMIFFFKKLRKAI